jgi:geranylgeranyl diphosphate synthase type I
LLGIWGQADVTGKPVADDIRRRKKSLPVVYILGRPNDPNAERLRSLYAQEALSEEEVAEAVAILEACETRPYAEELARQYLEMALAELEAAKPDPEAGEALQELAHFLIKRNY